MYSFGSWGFKTNPLEEHTVSPTHSRSIAHLWYDLWVLWLSIVYLKSAAKRFFSSYFNKYSSDLSKYAKIIHFGQQAAELCAPKVGGQKNPRPFGFEATFYVVVHGRILAKIKKVKVDELWPRAILQPVDQNENFLHILKDVNYIW